jgi:hypothetical protein
LLGRLFIIEIQDVVSYSKRIHSTTLQCSARADSPTNDFIDDSIDTIVLDEDLASIARQVQARVNRRGDLESGGGPEIVTVQVYWLRHPLNSDGRADLGSFEMKRVLLLSRHFHEMLVIPCR